MARIKKPFFPNEPKKPIWRYQKRGFDQKNEVRIKEGWDVVKLTVERIRKMVTDILFYAKERDLRLEWFDIQDFIEEIAKELEPQLKNRKVEFVRDFDADLGQFEVDGTYVHSALLNITWPFFQ